MTGTDGENGQRKGTSNGIALQLESYKKKIDRRKDGTLVERDMTSRGLLRMDAQNHTQ